MDEDDAGMNNKKRKFIFQDSRQAVTSTNKSNKKSKHHNLEPANLQEEKTKYDATKNDTFPQLKELLDPISSDSESSVIELVTPTKIEPPILDLSSDESKASVVAKEDCINNLQIDAHSSSSSSPISVIGYGPSTSAKTKLNKKRHSSSEYSNDSDLILIEVDMDKSIRKVNKGRKKNRKKRKEELNTMKTDIEINIRNGVLNQKTLNKAVFGHRANRLKTTSAKRKVSPPSPEAQEWGMEPFEPPAILPSLNPNSGAPDKWTPEMKQFYLDPIPQNRDVELSDVLSRMPANGQWDVNPEDFHRDFGTRGRYFGQGALNRVKCHNCSQWGHVKAHCTEKTRVVVCISCGVEGHEDTRCTLMLRCFGCNRATTIPCSSCQMCRNETRAVCERCGIRGHRVDRCCDQWRMYRYTTEVGPVQLPPGGAEVAKPPKRRYCPHCTKQGHYYDECPDLPSSSPTSMASFVSVFEAFPDQFYPQGGNGSRLSRPNHPAEVSFIPLETSEEHDVEGLLPITSQLSPKKKKLNLQLQMALKKLNLSQGNFANDYIKIKKSQNLLRRDVSNLYHCHSWLLKLVQKLTVYLLGQIGLQGGWVHVRELREMSAKLDRPSHGEEIPRKMLETIQYHYGPVFSGDYTFKEIEALVKLYIKENPRSENSLKIKSFIAKHKAEKKKAKRMTSSSV